jgi:hyperpolarization activated cyclic nucleotide-gated potassium channel 2
LIIKIIPKISPLFWNAGDSLYMNDDYPEEVYFISTGEVRVNIDTSLMSVYRDGDTLGALEVVYDVRRIGNGVCIRNTHMYSLDRTTYMNMLQSYPQLLNEIKQQLDARIAEIRNFIFDTTMLNRSIYEVIQDQKRKKNK